MKGERTKLSIPTNHAKAVFISESSWNLKSLNSSDHGTCQDANQRWGWYSTALIALSIPWDTILAQQVSIFMNMMLRRKMQKRSTNSSSKLRVKQHSIQHGWPFESGKAKSFWFVLGDTRRTGLLEVNNELTLPSGRGTFRLSVMKRLMLLWGFVLGQGLHRGSTWYHWGLGRPRHDPLVNKCLIENEGVKDVWPWWWSWIIVMMTYDYMIVWWFYTKMSEFFKAHVGFTPGAGLRAAPRRGFGRGSQLRRRCPCRGNSTENGSENRENRRMEKKSLEITGTWLTWLLLNLRWISMNFMHLMVFPSFRLPRGLGRGVGSQQPSQQESLRKVQSGLSGAGILILGCLKLKHGWKGRNMTCDRFQVWHERHYSHYWSCQVISSCELISCSPFSFPWRSWIESRSQASLSLDATRPRCNGGRRIIYHPWSTC